MRASTSSFTLNAGAQAQRQRHARGAFPPAARCTAASRSSGGRRKKRAGINVVHRLIGSLRFHPTRSARKLKLNAGTARVTGSGSQRALELRVRNGGNTIDPVGGSVVISGSRGGRSGGIASKAILPGKQIDLRARVAERAPARQLHRVGHALAGRSQPPQRHAPVPHPVGRPRYAAAAGRSSSNQTRVRSSESTPQRSASSATR